MSGDEIFGLMRNQEASAKPVLAKWTWEPKLGAWKFEMYAVDPNEDEFVYGTGPTPQDAWENGWAAYEERQL